MSYMTPLIPYSTINNISLSVNDSNFTSVFFKAACHPLGEGNFTGSKC